jgi:hypothetical protein
VRHPNPAKPGALALGPSSCPSSQFRRTSPLLFRHHH